MPKIVASIGECMVELFPETEGLYRRGFAGDSFNTAYYARALLPATAAGVRYVTAVGDDALSSRMLDFMQGVGLDTGAIRRLPGKTVGLYMISLEKGERSFTYWRGESAARMLCRDRTFLSQALAGVDFIYFSGVTLAVLPEEDRAFFLATLKELKDKGIPIAFDPNVRPRLWPTPAILRNSLEAAYRIASIALPTYEDEAGLYGDAGVEAQIARIASYGVAEIVVKNGPSPSFLFDRGSMTQRSPPAVGPPRDTTGAGDSFNGAYLAARLAGEAPLAALALAQQLAARVIMAPGALLPLADMQDLALRAL